MQSQEASQGRLCTNHFQDYFSHSLVTRVQYGCRLSFTPAPGSRSVMFRVKQICPLSAHSRLSPNSDHADDNADQQQQAPPECTSLAPPQVPRQPPSAAAPSAGIPLGGECRAAPAAHSLYEAHGVADASRAADANVSDSGAKRAKEMESDERQTG